MVPAVFLFLAGLGSGTVHEAGGLDQPELRRPAFCVDIPEGAVIVVRLMVDKDGQAIGDLVPQVVGAAPSDVAEAESRVVDAVRSALPFKDLPTDAANRPLAIRFDLDQLCGPDN